MSESTASRLISEERMGESGGQKPPPARQARRPADLQLMQLTTGCPLPPADVTAAGGTMTYPAMMIPAGLVEIARYADILAPDTRALIALDPAERLGVQAPIIADAHRAGLLVSPWTFRPENRFLPAELGAGTVPNGRNPDGSVAEISAYLCAGIASFFTDDPAIRRSGGWRCTQWGRSSRENQPVRRVCYPYQSTS